MNEYTISCGSINFRFNDAIMRELEYLACWRADLAYIVERFGSDDPEAEVSRKSVEFAFSRLDRMGCPYWLQNCALAYGEDWRGRMQVDFPGWLEKHGYNFRSFHWTNA